MSRVYVCLTAGTKNEPVRVGSNIKSHPSAWVAVEVVANGKNLAHTSRIEIPWFVALLDTCRAHSLFKLVPRTSRRV